MKHGLSAHLDRSDSRDVLLLSFIRSLAEGAARAADDNVLPEDQLQATTAASHQRVQQKRQKGDGRHIQRGGIITADWL